LEFALWQGIPVVVVGWLWWVNIRRIPLMGIGTLRPFQEGLGETVVWVLGAPRQRELVWAVAAAAVAAFVAELAAMGREGSREWVFYLIAVVAAPVAGLLARPPEAFYPRYLLVSVPFFLMVLARFFVRCCHAGGWRKRAAMVVLALFFAGNGVWVTRFLIEGRGHYREALNYMATQTKGEEVMVGSDQQFRNGMTMWFYATHWPPGKTIHHVIAGGDEGPPEWFIVHRFVGEADPPEWLSDRRVVYRRERRFGYAGASGWTWWVYHASGR
jgi:hypothetical protein